MGVTRKNKYTKSEIWKVIPIPDSTSLPDKFKRAIKYKDSTGKIKYIQPNALLIKIPQSGGAGDFPVVNKLLDRGLTFIATRDPTPVSKVMSGFFRAIEWPMKILKGNRFVGPFIEVWMSGLHGTIESAVSGSAGIAQMVAGPYGAAMALPVAVGIGAGGSMIAISEGDYGQAVSHIINAVPAIGPTISKAMAKVELIAEKIMNVRKRIAGIPRIGPKLVQYIPNIQNESSNVNKPPNTSKVPNTTGGKRGMYTRKLKRFQKNA